MEERKYNFLNKTFNVHYEGVTEEELKTLSYYYRKEEYLTKGQYHRMNTFLFGDVATDQTEITDYLEDEDARFEQRVTTEMLLKELFSVLNEKEKTVIEATVLNGHTMETAGKQLGVSTRQAKRYKKSGLDKLLIQIKKLGFENYNEAVEQLL
ncbi:MAG: sigma factor-like helix-turn-helix DNA-binding protein [Anaerostipes sp.]|nr:sigma factor-like helix-turn-helix DNA-binding protein [Anaerostipes sp.]MDD4371119.1 sigma factor-like helix-turn-helix DNA-binding protein [Anaerostipes sp.]